MNKISAEVLTIGNELLSGLRNDSNAQWLCSRLDEAGFEVAQKTTVGDHRAHIMQALAAAEQRAHVTLITGGLGPTSDDITKSCLANFFHSGMALDEEALAHIAWRLNRPVNELSEANRLQAVLPTACKKIHNTLGTAPGMWFERNGRVMTAMPGVPFEMEKMMTDAVMPLLRATFSPPPVQHRLIHTSGIGESALAERIIAWEHALPAHVRLAYLPSPEGVRLRLSSVGGIASDKNLQEWIDRLQAVAEPYIYGFEDDTLEAVVGALLIERQLTLATAESCTGGYLAHRITSVPGSSHYYIGSVIAYSNAAKTTQLGVSADLIDQHGAVSEPVAKQMAAGACQALGTDVGVGISGVAGPDGGTARTPVGTIWVAVSMGNETHAKKLSLHSNRLINIRLSATAALHMLRMRLTAQIAP